MKSNIIPLASTNSNLKMAEDRGSTRKIARKEKKERNIKAVKQ